MPDQEARALRMAWEFLLDLSSKPVPKTSELRRRAREVARHYPLAADARWLELHGIGDEQ